MDVNSDELELKNILVELEHEHQHLQVTLRQLQNAIDRRQVELRKILVDRELRLLKDKASSHQVNQLRKSQTTNFNQANTEDNSGTSSRIQPHSPTAGGDYNGPKFSSQFSKEVSYLLDKINQTSEEVSALIRL